MLLTLLVPGARVPAPLAAELAASLQAPALARRLQRADYQPATPGDAGSWLAAQLFGCAAGQPAPTAPYAWAALGGTTDPELTVWHAEPAHIAVGRDSLVLLPPDTPLDAADADALMASANAVLADDGARLRSAGGRWFLLVGHPWDLRPLPYDQALGQALPTGIPDAPDARRWMQLHNEIQMHWHDHPVNEAREALGCAAVNGLWLHGGGQWRTRPALAWQTLASDRPELRGLALARGATAVAADAPARDGALLVWDDAGSAARSGDWRTWQSAMQRIDARVATLPADATLDFVLAGTRGSCTCRSAPRDRWAMWRNRPLAAALAE
jgi:hypothetical protein